MVAAQLALTKNMNIMMTRSTAYFADHLLMDRAQCVRSTSTSTEVAGVYVFTADRVGLALVLVVRMGSMRDENLR